MLVNALSLMLLQSLGACYNLLFGRVKMLCCCFY